MNTTRTLACLLAGILTLGGCGGGGGDSFVPATGVDNPQPSGGGSSGAPQLPPALASSYTMRNLVGDRAGLPNTDPNLINGWGVAFNPTGFVWVANEGSSKSTLYDGNGVPNSLIVSIPAPAGADAAHPTGIVFNGTQDFRIGQGAGAASPFIFATLTGTLAAWSPTVNRTNALTVYDGSGEGRVFTALAIASNNGANMLYATDFAHGSVEMFDAAFRRVTAPGSFVDDTLPSNYLPFGVQAINGRIFVAYAQRDPSSGEEMPGAGLGLVSEFDAAGTFVRRVVTEGGALNAPWGMAVAPQGFGAMSGALLVANFGDGMIHAYDMTTGAALGPVSDANGNPIVIPGIWGIAFGNGVNNQPTTTLFFAAGPDDEEHGVYGRIDLNP